jgi:hypothetical protein
MRLILEEPMGHRPRPSPMVIRRTAVALALALAVAGCANNVDSGAGSPPSGVVAPPSSSAPPAPSTGASAGAVETISGTVAAGVEPNCLILQDEKGSHLLLFDNAALQQQAKVGANVTLTGRSEPDLMSTCQQGVPFTVISVTAK